MYFEIINQVENSLENYPCDIIRSSKTYFQRPAALGFRKNSPYLSLFNYKLGMYKQSGVLSNLASIRRHSTYTADCQGNQTLSVTYKQVFSAFLVFGIGIGISLLNAVVEFLCKRYLKPCKTWNICLKIWWINLFTIFPMSWIYRQYHLCYEIWQVTILNGIK